MSSYPVGVTSYLEPVLHALRSTPTGQTAICSGEDARPVPGCFDAEAATSCPLCREIIALRRNRPPEPPRRTADRTTRGA
jgi:hypothetical protein